MAFSPREKMLDSETDWFITVDAKAPNTCSSLHFLVSRRGLVIVCDKEDGSEFEALDTHKAHGRHSAGSMVIKGPA